MAHAFKKMSNCRVQSFCTGVFKKMWSGSEGGARRAGPMDVGVVCKWVESEQSPC